MLDTETSLRTLHAYVGLLQSRLALARATGSRQAFEGVYESQLAQVCVLSVQATDAVDAILDRLAPELASTAAAIADMNSQREFELPRRSAVRHLQLVAVQADRPA
jgi:hypothetical protein